MSVKRTPTSKQKGGEMIKLSRMFWRILSGDDRITTMEEYTAWRSGEMDWTNVRT